MRACCLCKEAGRPSTHTNLRLSSVGGIEQCARPRCPAPQVYMFKPAEAEAKQKAIVAAQAQAAKQNGSRGKKAKTPATAA